MSVRSARRTQRWSCTWISALCAMLVVLPIGAHAAPGGSDASGYVTPTVDPLAPTPTAPRASRPLLGTAPNGSVVGGTGLAKRGKTKAAGTPELPPGVRSAGWMVADLESGQVLAARDPHGRRYPASTLKTLLIDALYPVLDPKQVITANEEDISVEGSATGMVNKGRYSVHQLWLALMLGSDNQAANALARTAGGIDKTVALMNAKAQELRAYDTVAGTPSGLDVAGQSSSPYDLCLFMREILNEPAVLKIASTMTASLPPVPPKYGPVQFSNQNKLLYNYPGAIAGKTGFTDAARHTFVAAAAKGERRIVVSLMQGEQVPVPMWQQAASLLDWAFSTDPDTVGVGTLVEPGADIPAPTSAPAEATSAATAPNSDEVPVAGETVSAAPAAQHTRVPIWPILGGTVLICIAVAFGVRRRGRARH